MGQLSTLKQKTFAPIENMTLVERRSRIVVTELFVKMDLFVASESHEGTFHPKLLTVKN